jgi:hypothetical protein
MTKYFIAMSVIIVLGVESQDIITPIKAVIWWQKQWEKGMIILILVSNQNID